MKRTVILGGFIALLHTVLICANNFEIDMTRSVQVWEVQKQPLSEENGQELYTVNELETLMESPSEIIPFGSRQTFILLKKVDTDARWSIFYWLGVETTVEQRWVTAAMAGQLWYQIVRTPRTTFVSDQVHYNVIRLPWYTHTYERGNYSIFMPMSGPDNSDSFYKHNVFIQLPRYDMIIPIIHRETQYKESLIFLCYFSAYAVNQESITNIADGLKHANLYEIKSNRNRWFIDLVPLYVQKRMENIYVLDDRASDRRIYYQSVENDNSKELMNFLCCLIYEKLPDKIRINHINQSMKIDDRIDKLKWNNENLMRNTQGESSNTLNSDNEDFFKDSRSATSTEDSGSNNDTEDFPEDFCSDTITSDEERKVLYKLNSSRTTKVKWSPVKSLRMNRINEDKTFFLLNRMVKYFYVYLGKKSPLHEITYALETLEKCLNRYEGWTQVTFAVYDDIKQPAVFWVNFEDYPDYISSSKIPSEMKSLFRNKGLSYTNILHRR